MGDERSDTSSVWPADEQEVVNEYPLGPATQYSTRDLIAALEREEAVSAAVSVVVASARHGVVALCASVAHIIRDKMRLQHKVAELEKKLAPLEKSSTTSVSVSSRQVADSHSLHESPTTQRCGSAPPSFITNSRKFSRGGNQNVTGGFQISDQRSVIAVDQCDSCHQLQDPGRRTSAVTIPDSNSPPIQKNGEMKPPFLRGQSYASTRSLSSGRSPPSSSFMRKKYSTISLRRVQRSGMSKQGASPITWSSSNSHRSSANSLECRGSTSRASSKSCIVTVAEVYQPPTSCLTTPNTESVEQLVNTESDAVRLLARKLTNVIQESEAHLEDSLPNSPLCDPSVRDVTAPETTAYKQLCAPHPLAGCECAVCMHLAADPHSQLYIITTNEGSLLPRGSKVLVEGDRIGTVLYFGHSRYPSLNLSLHHQQVKSSASTCTTQAVMAESPVESSKMICDETFGIVDVDTASPVGVTITLWPPDQGEVFVPLCDVICQLDDEVDRNSKEHLDTHSVGDDDNAVDAHSYSTETVNGKLSKVPDMDQSNITPPSGLCGGIQEVRNRAAAPEWRKSLEEAFAQRLSISSCNSDTIHGLEDLPYTDQEGEVEDLVTSRRVNLQIPEQEAKSSDHTLYFHTNHNLSSSPNHQTVVPVISNGKAPCQNTTFLYQPRNEECAYSKTKCTESKVSLYDTSDSAISLTFNQRPQSFEESSDPPSLTDPDKDSHFGDTWDSGCCMERGRCISESSELVSDIEGEDTHLGSPWACNLSKALDSVWEKHRKLKDFNLDGRYSSRKMDLSKREVEQQDYSSRLQLLLENPEMISTQSLYMDSSLTEHTEV